MIMNMNEQFYLKVTHGANFFDFDFFDFFPVLFYLTIRIQSLHCLKGLSMRNTLNIARVPPQQGI